VLELYPYVTEEKNIALSSTIPNELSLLADPRRMRNPGKPFATTIKYTPSDGRVDGLAEIARQWESRPPSFEDSNENFVQLVNSIVLSPGPQSPTE
jgi:hypothetical protein